MDEVRAFLRAETTPRIAWRRRAWLGRRAAFALVERVILSRYWMSTRAVETERHAFVGALLEALEAVGALDIVSAGRWAETELTDPVEETAAVTRWEGLPAPAMRRKPPRKRAEP